MLDDKNYVSNLDPDGALEVAANQCTQLKYEYSLPHLSQPERVVFAGMGGSALAAVLLKPWLDQKLKVPFEIVRNYQLPNYVDDKTLVICCSYSGNTEETLAAFEQAMAVAAQIVVVTHGGALMEKAQSHSLLVLELPDTGQPRYAAFVGAKALAVILEAAGLIEGLVQSLASSSELLESYVQKWRQESPREDNMAKQLAHELTGTSPVIFGGPLLKGAAYKWKISLNENAKNVAFWNEWPEFNHNEFIGWSSHPIEKPFSVIELQSSHESERITERYTVSNRLLSGKMPEPHIIECQGDNDLQHILWATLLGDFTSLYLAILNGVNPTPVKLVEKLKEELNNS